MKTTNLPTPDDVRHAWQYALDRERGGLLWKAADGGAYWTLRNALIWALELAFKGDAAPDSYIDAKLAEEYLEALGVFQPAVAADQLGDAT